VRLFFQDAVKQRSKDPATPSTGPSTTQVNKETERSSSVDPNSGSSGKSAKHYCKFWFDPHIRDKDPNFKIPDSTKLKIAAYNQYILQYYAELISYRKQRASRLSIEYVVISELRNERLFAEFFFLSIYNLETKNSKMN
jgi:hypothetical protein